MAHPQTVQKTTVVDVSASQTSDVFNAIWTADKHRITPFHEKRFPADTFHGAFVVKVCDAQRTNTKAHNLFKLYKWDALKKRYEKATNKELLADPQFLSYKLVYNLFDNYESDETKPEVNTEQECKEILDFLNFVTDSDCMKVAVGYLRKKFASPAGGLDAEDKASLVDRVKFRNKLKKLWFDQYSWGKLRDMSGFEHTFVGERRADGQVMGYHFWYKYFVDDSVENATGQDAIDFNRRLDDMLSDDYVAIRFSQYVDADGDGVVDGDGDAQLFKSFGSFFVGCSAECKMALGTVAYYEGKAAWAHRRAGKHAGDRGDDEEGVHVNIRGHSYKLNLHRGGDKNQYCRSFYPEKHVPGGHK